MKLFVWNRANHATGSYHDEGGIVVIADSLERAREMLAAKTRDEGAQEECSAATKEPDLVRYCDGPEWIAIHPDAGCC